MDILKSDIADVKKDIIDGEIPVYILSPKYIEKPYKTIVFYHGWSSAAVNQIFRANIFVSYGYQVILPEALYHGERGTLDYEDEMIFGKYFAKVLLNNLEEWPKIYNYIYKNCDIDKLYISGHSMGAMTAGAIFGMDDRINAAVVFNGALKWEWLIEWLDDMSEDQIESNKKLREFDPMNDLKNYINRPIAMLNGELDDIVSPKAEEDFYNELYKLYDKKDRIYFGKYEETYHQLTTYMIEDAIRFLKIWED